MADQPKPRPVVRLKLPNFREIPDKPGEHRRRYRNVKTGEEISRREFAARAKRVVVYEKPKERLTVHEKRVKWYANHYNHEVFNSATPTNHRLDEYISYETVEDMEDFKMYESLIRSRDPELRELGYDYFNELEYEYEYEDWGESPGAA